MSDDLPAVQSQLPAAQSKRRSRYLPVGQIKDDTQGRLEDASRAVLDRQLVVAAPRWVEQTEEQELAQIDGLVAMRMLLDPRDMIEELLITQMLGMQEAASRSMARAARLGASTEFVEKHLAIANKCSRTFAALVEALNRHRGKGQQKVTVEHVHVHAGGQAIVGTVEAGGTAGGNGKNE